MWLSAAQTAFEILDKKKSHFFHSSYCVRNDTQKRKMFVVFCATVSYRDLSVNIALWSFNCVRDFDVVTLILRIERVRGRERVEMHSFHFNESIKCSKCSLPMLQSNPQINASYYWITYADWSRCSKQHSLLLDVLRVREFKRQLSLS